MGTHSRKMKYILSLATVALAGRGNDPWRVFGGPNNDGICHAVLDEELYQSGCAITVHVRQNHRTPELHSQDDTYNQFMPSHVFDFNLQNSMEDNQNALAQAVNHDLRHENCAPEDRRVYCVGAVLEVDGRVCSIISEKVALLPGKLSMSLLIT